MREERGQRIGRAFVGAVLGRRRVGATRSDSIGASVASSASRTKLSAALTSSCEVLDAVLPVLLGPVVRDEPLPRSRARPSRAAAGRASPSRSFSISRTNAAERSCRPCRRPRRSPRPATGSCPAPARASCSCSSVRAPMPRGGKLTTRRNAPSSSGAGDEPQVGERVLDLRALEEAHAAVDAVRNAGAEQRMLEHARLRVGAIQHRDLVERHAVGARGPCTTSTMNAASSRSVGAANTRTGSPLPSLVHRFLPSRAWLCRISALAASRMWPCER